MFNATEIEHAIQALEREIDTEMNTVNVRALVMYARNSRRMSAELTSPSLPLTSSSATSSTTGTSTACTTTYNLSEPR